MVRFRRSGKNWEGRLWKVAAPVDSLAGQIEAAYPVRHPKDGTVASKGHDANSPTSDHRPKPTSGAGVVRAIDFGEHIEEAFGILDAIRASQDSRLKYGIHESQMFSSYPSGGHAPYTWRPYGGSNAHLDHGHISTLKSADAQGGPWDIGTGDDDDMPVTEEEMAAIAQKVWEFPGGSGVRSVHLVLDRTYRNVNELILAHRAGTLGTTAMAEIDDEDLLDIAEAVADEQARRLVE